MLIISDAVTHPCRAYGALGSAALHERLLIVNERIRIDYERSHLCD